METFNLNTIPGAANPVCHVSQFDEGRSIRVNLFEGAAIYTLDGTETISISVRKPDGHLVVEGITNTSDSYVEIITTEQMTACAGENLCELKIEKGSDTIGSLNFIMQVEPDPLDGGDPSESFVYNLEVQIAAAVAQQYDADSVVFDNAPTAGHGVGFAVTSEGVKTGLDLKANSADLATVATSGDYNDLSNLPTIPTDLDDLTDVTITTPSDDDILVYQNGEWVNMANPASTANFADAYDPTATYNTGDVCIYNNVLYICTEDNITGTFDPSKWTATTIDNVIGSLSTLTTTDKSSIVGAVNEVDGNKPDNTVTSPFLKVKTTENITKSITANSYASILGSDINLAEAGYTPIGIVSMYNTQSAGCFFGSFDCSVVSGTATFAIVKNTSASNITATMNFKILFMRTTN